MAHDHDDDEHEGHDETDDGGEETPSAPAEVDHAAVLEALHRAVERNEKVVIEREAMAHEHWNGFPLVVGDDFVLVRTLHDFTLDGFAVLRLRDITAVQSGESERFFERVLRAEGMLARAAAPKPVLLRSWRSVIESVRTHYRWAILESERADENNFVLGELAAVSDDTVWVHYIQVDGTRESERTKVSLDDLTLLRFDEQYVNLFGRYAVGDDHH